MKEYPDPDNQPGPKKRPKKQPTTSSTPAQNKDWYELPADYSGPAPGTMCLDDHGELIYVCNAGDTALETALRFGVRTTELVASNRAWYMPDLKRNSWLKCGTQLHVPMSRQEVPQEVPRLEWAMKGNVYIGRRVLRVLGAEESTGVVVAHLPAGADEGEPALWRVVYEDASAEDGGDEEDLTEAAHQPKHEPLA
jgi:hypothetical protein